MLCAICISMFQGPLNQGHHHASFGNLVRAAESGCKICKCLCRFREDQGPDEASERHTNPFIRFEYFQHNREYLHIVFSSEASWMISASCGIQLHLSDLKETPEWWPTLLGKTKTDLLTQPWRVRVDNFPRRSIPSHTGDPEVLELALEWLRSCKTRHITCKDGDETQDCKYHPTRLLDIANMGTQTCRLLIVERECPIDDSGYVALSHCWGKDPSFLTLTYDNLDELQRGIQLHRLPKSFVDAIQICRQLGFRYLWIDSLCIIQSGPGSDEDWQLHAATMDMIYTNCELNLALARAADAEQGAFVDRDPDFLQTACVYQPLAMDPVGESGANSTAETSSKNINTTESAVQDVKCSGRDESASDEGMSRLVTIFASHYDFQSALWRQPLQRRGWVFQERLLAPRTLHFGKDRIYWECKEKLHNEYLPWGLPGSREVSDQRYQRPFSLPYLVTNPTLHELTKEDIASLHESWYDLVRDYGERNLTYPNKDKLVAIAAIAKRFNRVLTRLLWNQSKYCGHARLFEGDGWRFENGWEETIQIDDRQDSAYRAPSWSWASVNGGAHFDIPTREEFDPQSTTYEIIATVVSANVKLVDQRNPYGQLSAGEITIQGPLPKLSSSTGDYCTTSYSGSREEEGFERFSEVDELVALHILVEYDLEDGVVWPRVHGLVLARIGTGRYRRIGSYLCAGPARSQYPACNFQRATVTIV